MNVIGIVLLYLAGVNLLGFASMGYDKWKAKKHAWRVPESTLFLIALIGGSLGSILGMHLFRHKTRHWYFVYGLPAILALQLAAVYLVLHAPIQFQIL